MFGNQIELRLLADLYLSRAFYLVQWVYNKVDEWKYPTNKSVD